MDTLDPAGVAVFIAVLSAVIALASDKPEQWGGRRAAFGLAVAASACAALMLAYSPWWWTGLMWGSYQFYLGCAFIKRRAGIASERFEYISSTVRVLSYIALADGRVSATENDIISRTYARAGFSQHELRHVSMVVSDCEREFLSSGSDPERLFILLKEACALVGHHSNRQIRFGFLRTAVSIAANDGFVGRDENRALKATAIWLGLSAADLDQAWASNHGNAESRESQRDEGYTQAGDQQDDQQDDQEPEQHSPDPSVPPDLATYYASLLGVPLTATSAEIKQAYRAKAKAFHPDVVTHKGPRFAEVAEERFKEIRKAYDFLRGASRAAG